jgi:hypothetical protein
MEKIGLWFKWFFTESGFFINPPKNADDATFNIILLVGLLLVMCAIAAFVLAFLSGIFRSLLPRKPVVEYRGKKIYRRIHFIPEYLLFDPNEYYDQNGKLHSEQDVRIMRIILSHNPIRFR